MLEKVNIITFIYAAQVHTVWKDPETEGRYLMFQSKSVEASKLKFRFFFSKNELF